jgi:hypothetical protein
MEMPGFTVSGRLTDDGRPAAYVGIRLVANDITPLARDRDGDAAVTVTGPEGRFSLLGVPPGAYTLKELPDLDDMRRLAPQATLVAIADGTQTTIQVHVVALPVQ